MNFPGHRYFGPGNDSDNGTPIDKDDFIAKKHDIEYEKAKTACDVREADRKAIALFWFDYMLNKNWHSSLGVLGLGIKYIVESFTGVLYPSNVGPCNLKDIKINHKNNMDCMKEYKD